jgi:prepilin-type N-terminal cleavage/methylation domain-containing protein
MKSKSGFTIVEVILTVVIVGILAGISIFSFLKVQQQAQDNQRSTNATLISESLEKYFQKNGEYPSVATVTNGSASAAQTSLGLTSLDNLINPSAAGGSNVNIWKSGAASANNRLTYSGNTDVSSTCMTATGATSVCTDYKIQYYKEDTGTVETIYSRNKSSTVSNTIASNQQIAPPATPSLTVALNGANVLATAGAVTCQPGATLQYAFLSRINDGSWTTGAWAASNTASTAATQGVKYGYQVKSQCVLNGVSSPDSALASERTYIHPINTPGTIALGNSSTAPTTTWSWTAYSCPAGTTAYYTIASGNDYDTSGAQNWWMGWSADQTGASWARGTLGQGYNYAAKAKVRCASAFTTSAWGAESNTSTYLRPIDAPGLASGWSYSPINGRTEYDWWWAEPACGQGTARYWQWDAYIGDVNNGGGTRMYWRDKGPYNHYWYGATAPSWQDPGWYTGNNLGLTFDGASTNTGIDVYARILYKCQNPDTQRNAVGSWSQSPGYST